MNGHYMEGCFYPHFRHLLKENAAGLADEQRGRIRRVKRVSAILYIPALIERAYYGKRIERTKIEKPPVFIVGHWRSGTTYLFNLMSCDDDMSYTDSITTFTCHNYIGMRRILPRFFEKALPGDRFGDDMEFLPHSPQEECYAVANTIDETFTHLITFPENAKHYMDLSFEDGLTSEQQKKWADTHRRLLKKLTYYRGGKRILFKSPDNTAKLYMLHKIYPDAKFVHIYRNPYKSLKSTINMYSEGIKAMTFESVPSSEYITDLAIDFYGRIYRQYFKDLEKMPKGSIIEVAYSDLVKAPIETLERIYTELDLPDFDRAKPKMLAHVQSQKAYKPNNFKIDPVLRDKINSRLGFFFDHYGIPMQTGEEE